MRLNRIVTIATQNIIVELWVLILSIRESNYNGLIYVYSYDDLTLPPNCILKKINPWWEKEIKLRNTPALLKPYCFLDEEWNDGDNILFLDSADIIVFKNIQKLFDIFEKSDCDIGAYPYQKSSIPFNRQYKFIERDFRDLVIKRDKYYNNGVVLFRVNDESKKLIKFWDSMLRLVPEKGSFGVGMVGDQIPFNLMFRMFDKKLDISSKWNYRGCSNVYDLVERKGRIVTRQDFEIYIAHATGVSGKIPDWMIKHRLKTNRKQIEERIKSLEKKKKEKPIEKNISDPHMSIIMACYNCENYIKKAIDSVKNQTYPNWELVIVDDASTDNTYKKIKESIAGLDNVVLIRKEKNKGSGSSRKTAMKNVSYDTIVVLDGDDALVPTALEELRNKYIENPSIGIVHSTYYRCDKDLNILQIEKWVKPIKDTDSPEKVKNVGHLMSFKKQIYDLTSGYSDKYRRATDRFLYYQLFRYSKSVFIDKPLYYYRRNFTAKESKEGFENDTLFRSIETRREKGISFVIDRDNDKVYESIKNCNIPYEIIESPKQAKYNKLYFFKTNKPFNRSVISKVSYGKSYEDENCKCMKVRDYWSDIIPKNKIPKIIHQIWMGDKPSPKFMTKWKELNPDYEYVLWDEERIKNFKLKNLTLYKSFEGKGRQEFRGKSDVVRVEILQRYGGIYIDADCDPLRPLDDELLQDDCFGVYINNRLRGNRVSNGVIGTIPNGIIISEYVDRLSKIKNTNCPPFKLTGPIFFTKICEDYKDKIKIYPSHYFYPYFFEEGGDYEGDFKPYTNHYWGSTIAGKKKRDIYGEI